MIKLWKPLSYTSKFSIIAFLLAAILGLLSMGLLGFALYYCVFFLFNNYPNINDWTGDWVWPAVIVAGTAWSLGFVFAGIAWHFLHKKIKTILLLRIIYIAILWLWAATIWHLIITTNLNVAR
ncbi:hypothetical protein Q4512_11825 [Oceanihabitans sp. 2_MG-2023]|uniref:hypothetical protein n=1 Tax=Oceanihabitans sp. 2_MG-2023 TaxID=3062661 RepID=UPI0026E3A2BC|nr:hypothetical protein [Oceanihabitans sp. 2_MG-2023]MDO6597605.1 hypothetical protein [Oceanihabitans sp. 2_MG-2023]